MAEEEGKKDDFEFTDEGEALDYISLDQARLLAMQTARDAPGDYGRRFTQAPMAFVVTEATDTEDYYVITLSFRPQGDFAGVSGREQFFIDKEGNVAHRQVLGLPRRRRFPLAAVIIAVLLAGAAVFVVTGVLTGRGFGGGRNDDGGAAVVAPINTKTPTPRAARSDSPAFPRVDSAPRQEVVPVDSLTPTGKATTSSVPAAQAPSKPNEPELAPTPTFTPRPTPTPRPTKTLAPTPAPAETTLQGRPVVASTFEEFCSSVKLEVESWDLPRQLPLVPGTGTVVIRYRVPLGGEFETLFFSVRTSVSVRGREILSKYPDAPLKPDTFYHQPLGSVDRFRLTTDGLWHVRSIPIKVPSESQFMGTGKPGGVPTDFSWADFVQPPYEVFTPPNFAANFRLGAKVIQVGATRYSETSG